MRDRATAQEVLWQSCLLNRQMGHGRPTMDHHSRDCGVWLVWVILSGMTRICLADASPVEVNSPSPAELITQSAVTSQSPSPVVKAERVRVEPEDDSLSPHAAIQNGVEPDPHQATAVAKDEGTSKPAMSQSASVEQSQASGALGEAVSPGLSLEHQPLGTRAVTGSSRTSPGPTTVDRTSWVLNTITALGIVVGLIFATRAMLSRAGRGGALTGNNSVVEVLCRVPVAGRHHVVLIRVGKRILALGDASAGLSTLADIDDPEEVASLLAVITAAKPNSVSRSFSQLISRFHTQYPDEHLAEQEDGGSEYRVARARDQVSNLLARMRSDPRRGGVV